MVRPPHQRKRVTQKELDREFNENGWEKRLQHCDQREHYNKPTPPQGGQPLGTLTILYEYYENDTYIALTCRYLKPDGKLGASGKPSPKELLIGEVYHYV